MEIKKTSKLISAGTQFGRLTVLKLLDKRIHKSRVYLCQCSCGKICEKTAQALRNQNVQSCGCLAKEVSSKNNKNRFSKNLQGQRFGKLIAITPTEKRLSGSVVWECQCDCGMTTFVSATNLTKGNTQSCGCLRSKGELKIAQLLKEHNIPFIKEYTFDDLRSDKNSLLRFDFFVNNQYLIEFDGYQHEYDTSLFSHDSFEQRKINDNKKTQYALEHNIPLIRISYHKLKDLSIQDLLLK